MRAIRTIRTRNPTRADQCPSTGSSTSVTVGVLQHRLSPELLSESVTDSQKGAIETYRLNSLRGL